MASREAITTTAEPSDSNRDGSRAARSRMPVARNLVEAAAISYGVCVHPVPVRRIDQETGATEIVDVPCGATLESKCPPCAARGRSLRIAQFRTGWHMDHEPVFEPDDPTDHQLELATLRADLEAALVQARTDGLDEAPIRASIKRVEDELTRSGVRGKPTPSQKPRRVRSTKRRQDVPDLPLRKVEARTIGRTFSVPNGKAFRPSIFLTVTCRSYGRVDKEGVPYDMDAYDYKTAARDSIHYPKVIDRLWQNMRRVVGYDVQYMGTLEPQRRLAPHLHVLIRGTISRADLRQIVAATYHQVWWPSTDTVRYDGHRLPVWDEDTETYVDPDTGEALPTWDEALDVLDSDDQAEPSHVVRFGSQLRAEGVLAPRRPTGASATSPSTSPRTSAPSTTPKRAAPARSSTTTGSGSRCATNPARPPAPTGCATESSPATPSRVSRRVTARQGPPP